MRVFDKLRSVGTYIRKGWRSTGPDSYFHYKRGRERERKAADRAREGTDRSAGLEREEAQRTREHKERYTAERAAEESRGEAPPADPRKPQ
jgi:hypothetical protein